MDEIRCSIEVREDESRLSPGRVYGELLTYGQRAKDRPELFEDGALKWNERGIILNRQHDRKSPVMRFVPKAVENRVVIDEQLPNTVAGRDAAAEVRQGLFRGLSIEFRSIRDRHTGGVRRISEAKLGAAALVDDPSYDTTVEVRGRKTRRRRIWL